MHASHHDDCFTTSNDDDELNSSKKGSKLGMHMMKSQARREFICYKSTIVNVGMCVIEERGEEGSRGCEDEWCCSVLC